MNVILLGAPGAGKGTQANNIIKDFNIPHISTGDIFRQNIRDNTPLGIKAKEYMNQGKLVPDQIVIDIVAQRIREEDCKNGFLLDGFPRTLPQAEELDKIVNIDIVINLQMDKNTLISRISGRRVCNMCGSISHVDFLNGGQKCECGGEFIQREDDKEETVKERLKVYENQTKPLIEYYANKGILKNIDAGRYKDQVYCDVYAALKSL